MKMKYDCLPCLFRQTLESARMVTDDDQLIRDILKKYSKKLPELIDSKATAPMIAEEMQSYIKEISGNSDPYAKIIKSGSKAPGMIMSSASKEFLKHYQKADLVISKGQGNLESLYGIESGIYFLLKAKCEVIAEALKVDEGDFIFIYS